MRLKKAVKQSDWFLFGLVVSLTIFGVVMVGNASVIESYRDFGDKFYYLRHQATWAALGLLALGVFTLIDYRHLKKLAVPLLVITLASLVLVLIPGFGSEVLGARRWLHLGPLRFQPTELAKFSLVLYLASFFAKKKSLSVFLALMGLLIFLVMMEPDLGTTLIIVVVGFSVYFISGAPTLVLLGLSLLGSLGAAFFIFFSPYRRERLFTFLDPTRDPLGASYHLRQILLALGSGGFLGLGLGKSRQKYEYLPMVSTDSIFAIIGEEIGFIGASLLILAFLFLFWRGLKIALNAEDEFGRLLAIGLTVSIVLQALVNFGAMVALLPLTGIPLPFISYGGSSLVLSLASMGVLLNISSHQLAKR